MKKNISIFGLFAAILLTFNISSASADPTYAVLDTNGNVTNIIVCGSACASGEFGGNKVVLQVPADPVTGANRGGIWHPGNTTYNESNGTFTVHSPQPEPIQNNFSTVETDEESTTKSSVAIVGETTSYSFKYEDTFGDNLFTKNGFVFSYTDNTSASIFVDKNNTIESLNFETRKTNEEIIEAVQISNLQLLTSKIQTLISLLGSWIK